MRPPQGLSAGSGRALAPGPSLATTSTNQGVHRLNTCRVSSPKKNRGPGAAAYFVDLEGSAQSFGRVGRRLSFRGFRRIRRSCVRRIRGIRGIENRRLLLRRAGLEGREGLALCRLDFLFFLARAMERKARTGWDQAADDDVFLEST